MGHVKGKFIKGQMGNLVYREYRGTQIVQSKPHITKSHLTLATKQAAKVFGIASKLAGGIRWGQSYIYGKHYDGTMIYRLNAEVLRCLNAAKNAGTSNFSFEATTFQTLAGFEFNAASLLKNHFFAQPLVTVKGTELMITIPELKIPGSIKSPIDRLKSCKLVLLTSMIDLNNNRTNFLAPQVMDIPYSTKPTTIASQVFHFNVLPGFLCIIGISLQYIEENFIGETIVNSKSLNPAAILHAFIAEGTADAEESKNWYDFS